MGGGGTQTTTETSGLNNKQLDAAVSTIGTKLNQQLGSGLKVYDQSLYPGLSGQTMAGISSLSSNPNNSVFSSGVSEALAQQGKIAAGNFDDDPLRSRIMDDVSTQTNAAFNASGRFGGGSNQQALTDNLVSALAPYDYQRQQAAVDNLGTLYTMSNMPAAAQLQAGQIMDADMLARRQGEADLFDRQQNNSWNSLARGTSILAGAAPSGGTTTSTTTPTAPWWQQALGYVAGNAGRAIGTR